ncbi:hypothetical protein OIU79_013395 [Salix purpurea]|uniref:DUF4220 domain-containing protein n=1 Tax=Salix purpurea TaxID=77065 RepID=A0A9Q0Q636_SALPP|nr:hypothetical protein OIU79_013395 [Salix purpurea]
MRTAGFTHTTLIVTSFPGSYIGRRKLRKQEANSNCSPSPQALFFRNCVFLGLLAPGLIEGNQTWAFLSCLKLFEDYGTDGSFAGVMLLSLFLQIFLILFGRRRKYTAGFWIGTLVWLAYLSADWVATFSLGILAQKIGDSETNCTTNSSRGTIPAFWAPVLLVHLGGPDTITAYSMEDNELWLRHLLVLGSQVAVAFYAFARSWWGKDPLLFIAIPIFVAGIIKYGERNWVLRSASSKQCRNEMNELSRKFEEFSNPDVFEMTDEPVVGEVGLSDIIPQAKFLHEADLCFQMFRVLFADLVLGDSIHLATHIFLEKNAKEAFQLIEVEMGFMYDVLYTKLAKVRLSRVIFRATTFLCLVSALLAFSLGMSRHNHAYLLAEINISYLLLYGAIVIEIYSVVVLVFSDWAMLWLTGQRKPLFNSVYRTICSSRFLNNDKRWETRMAQHNLIKFQLSKRKLTSISLKKLLDKLKSISLKKLLRKLKSTSLKKLLGKSNIQSLEDVGDDLKDLIFQHLLDKRGRYKLMTRSPDPGSNDLHAILSERGDQVIGREKCLGNFGWSVKLPDFNDSLLTWHIATDICYHDDVRKNGGGDATNIPPNCKMSIKLSNYMVYLLVEYPFCYLEGSVMKGTSKPAALSTMTLHSWSESSLINILHGISVELFRSFKKAGGKCLCCALGSSLPSHCRHLWDGMIGKMNGSGR